MKTHTKLLTGVVVLLFVGMVIGNASGLTLGYTYYTLTDEYEIEEVDLVPFYQRNASLTFDRFQGEYESDNPFLSAEKTQGQDYNGSLLDTYYLDLVSGVNNDIQFFLDSAVSSDFWLDFIISPDTIVDSQFGVKYMNSSQNYELLFDVDYSSESISVNSQTFTVDLSLPVWVGTSYDISLDTLSVYVENVGAWVQWNQLTPITVNPTTMPLAVDTVAFEVLTAANYQLYTVDCEYPISLTEKTGQYTDFIHYRVDQFTFWNTNQQSYGVYDYASALADTTYYEVGPGQGKAIKPQKELGQIYEDDHMEDWYNPYASTYEWESESGRDKVVLLNDTSTTTSYYFAQVFSDPVPTGTEWEWIYFDFYYIGPWIPMYVGDGGSSNSIYMLADSSNLRVYNGSVSGWDNAHTGTMVSLAWNTIQIMFKEDLSEYYIILNGVSSAIYTGFMGSPTDLDRLIFTSVNSMVHSCKIDNVHYSWKDYDLGICNGEEQNAPTLGSPGATTADYNINMPFHNGTIRFMDNDAGDKPSMYGVLDGTLPKGEIELNVFRNTTDDLFFLVYDGSTSNALYLRMSSSFRYYDGSAYHTIGTFAANRWYHIRVEWDTAAGFAVWLDGVNVLNYDNGAADFQGTPSLMDGYIIYGSTTGVDYEVYLHGIYESEENYDTYPSQGIVQLQDINAIQFDAKFSQSGYSLVNYTIPLGTFSNTSIVGMSVNHPWEDVNIALKNEGEDEGIGYEFASDGTYKVSNFDFGAGTATATSWAWGTTNEILECFLGVYPGLFIDTNIWTFLYLRHNDDFYSDLASGSGPNYLNWSKPFECVIWADATADNGSITVNGFYNEETPENYTRGDKYDCDGYYYFPESEQYLESYYSATITKSLPWIIPASGNRYVAPRMTELNISLHSDLVSSIEWADEMVNGELTGSTPMEAVEITMDGAGQNISDPYGYMSDTAPEFSGNIIVYLCGDICTSLSVEVQYKMEWGFYFETQPLTLIDRLTNLIAPSVLLLMFPISLKDRFPKWGVYIGLIMAFGIMAFASLVDVWVGIVLTIFSLMLLVIKLKRGDKGA